MPQHITACECPFCDHQPNERRMAAGWKTPILHQNDEVTVLRFFAVRRTAFLAAAALYFAGARNRRSLAAKKPAGRPPGFVKPPTKEGVCPPRKGRVAPVQRASVPPGFSLLTTIRVTSGISTFNGSTSLLPRTCVQGRGTLMVVEGCPP